EDIQTAKDIIKLKPKMVRIYPVLVIRGTQLEKEYNEGDFTPLTVGQAVERSKEILKLFNKEKIQVIRIGLQNTDTITEPTGAKSEVVSGPYHPAFGQLVQDAIWYDRIVDEIKKINAKVIKVEIEANFKDINNIIGHKKENINKLKETYAVITTVKENNKIKQGKFKINVLQVA
ncbi:MAG: radical SAM protein, partial [Clostridia bacterium]